MSGETLTREEVDNLLDVQSIKNTLANVVEGLGRLTDSVKHYSEAQDREFKDIEEELRKAEVSQVNCKNELREELYGAFIQKKDLKIYLAIIVAAVSITTGAIQWMMAANTKAANTAVISAQSDVMVNRIVEAIEHSRRYRSDD